MREQPEFEAYGVGLCFASVCTRLTDDEATVRLNRIRPTGVGPWKPVDDSTFSGGEPNPCPCPDDDRNRHVLFVC